MHDFDIMGENELKLGGGQSAQSIVRIGDTVHRSMAQNSAFVHSILLYLEENDFPYAPRFLGVDREGREILSFIEGEVPRGLNLNEQQMSACAKILRRFHDIASTSPLCGGRETICHRDFAPWNVVFRNNVPVGIIDFDEVKPGERIEDLAYFIWTFLDLGLVKMSYEEQIECMLQLCISYGLDHCGGLVDAMIKEQNRILDFRRNVVLYDNDEKKRDFSLEAIDRIEVSKKWINRNRNKIERGLSRLLEIS